MFCAPLETVVVLLSPDDRGIEPEQELGLRASPAEAYAMPGVDKPLGAGYPHAMIPASLPDAEVTRIRGLKRRFGLPRWTGAPRSWR